MAIRVGINGFGRIGRLVFRRMMEKSSLFEVVGINDITDTKTLAYLLKYDSVHRRFNGEVCHDAESITVNGRKIRAMAIKDPATLPWKDLGVDVVIESTGIFTARGGGGKAGYGSHLDAGAKRVVLSAPAKDSPDLTCVLGVNDDQLTPAMKCVCNASCTTNCLAPVAKVLQEKFGIVKGLMTTIHAYTNDQRVLDLPHSDLYRPGRRVEHHPDQHRRRQGRRPGDPRAQGEDDRHFDARARADRQRGRPCGRDGQAGHEGSRECGDQGGRRGPDEGHPQVY